MEKIKIPVETKMSLKVLLSEEGSFKEVGGIRISIEGKITDNKGNTFDWPDGFFLDCKIDVEQDVVLSPSIIKRVKEYVK